VPTPSLQSKYTPTQLKNIFDFGVELLTNPRIPVNNFHREYKPYKRKKTTAQLIKRAFDDIILLGPFLFCNTNLELTLLKKDGIPFDLYEEKKVDPETTTVTVMSGDWSLLWIYKGASTLKYANVIYPTYPEVSRLENLTLTEKGKLNNDPYPHCWDDLDWRIYDEMRRIREKSLVEVGEKLGYSWKTIGKRFKSLSEQCKIFLSFFPSSYYLYNDLLLTFETDYEIGLENALCKIDRTSFIWKFDELILLMLHISMDESPKKILNRFGELQEMGLIRHLKVSIPIKTYSSVF
jgi:hypothetical protein